MPPFQIGCSHFFSISIIDRYTDFFRASSLGNDNLFFVYFRIVSENDQLDPDNFYCTKDNFVWGLKVMDGIDHAQEKTDFTQAYKFFKEWVTSGGTENKEWYQNNDSKDRELRVPVN